MFDIVRLHLKLTVLIELKNWNVEDWEDSFESDRTFIAVSGIHISYGIT